VENTRNFAQNASADQLLPQLQMVVQELTKFGTWEIRGDKSFSKIVRRY
jgi:hypothetical protein